jgi:hypothetical protein
MKKKVFLGGTCNGSKWRDGIKPQLKIEYFDPVCSGEWTQEAYLRELQERETADFVLYVITPKMTGVYSVAEVVDDSNKRPNKTLFCFLDKDEIEAFSAAQIKSLNAVAKMVKDNGGKVFETLAEIVKFLNTFAASDHEIRDENEPLTALG